ncbi:hypothetical protein MAM1_0522c10835 [Mucor ambiguus]|uniref:Uncharacterized protein n=1 Tax=Mucor ambiguus TaxID=91626 RepID=A0A0C9MKI9_9FUNG|nr:hypothetical protein MAM1_0522c10835 [Mucor ambiguus]
MFPKLGIHDSQVLDIHFPVHTVVSFLMHYDFMLEFTTLMKNQLHVDPLLDFDPLEDRNLLDPTFSSLESVSRSQKTNDLYNKRVLGVISFFLPKLMPFWLIPWRLAPNSLLPLPLPTASSAKRKAKKRLRLDYYFNLKYLDPLSASTIASSSPLTFSLSPTPTGPQANDVSMQS